MIVVIINKGSGSGGDTSKRVREEFRRLDADVDVITTKGSDVTKTARQAVAWGADVVVAAGGDGTVSAVAFALVGSSTPMGILPLGTLNHYAKDAGIPLDLTEAVNCVLAGYERALDVATVNGRVFINNSSIGLYPLMVRDRDRQRFRFKRSKWWAMVLASLATFQRFPIFHVQLNIDAATLRYDTPAVFVGNNEYHLDAFSLGRRAMLDAGELCVYAVRTLSRWRTLALAFRSLFIKQTHGDLFEIACTQNMTLNTDQTSIDVSLDGEVVRMSTPLEYGIMKRSLNVIVPAP